jgi:hypothetical protein
MHHRPLRRAIALSLGALLIFAGTAAADTVRADGDVTTPVIDATANLGAVAPGSVHTVNVGFVLTCANGSHVDAGQTVTATYAGAIEPEDGKILSVTDGTVGPAPANWPADRASCASPAQTFAGGTPSVVTLQAPTIPGKGYVFSLMFDRSISPEGANDSAALSFSTGIDIRLDVNTPPTLILPTLAGVGTVEGNAIGGWMGPWLGLAATDAEDDPDPTPSCTPPAGTLLPVGPMSVTCAVTDGGGLTTSATFTLTVVDTTPPALLSVPDDYSVTTNDPTGTTLLYGTPSAMDSVDSHPVVDCLPASGLHVDLGTTAVTCSATDASGNAAQDSFDVTVAYVSPHVATATWGEPVSGSGTTLTANRGRNIPIKVELFVDGVARTSGDAELLLSPCATGSGIRLALVPGNGRWSVGLDTSTLDGSCYTATATIDGLEAGSFRLEFRGTAPVRANTGKR